MKPYLPDSFYIQQLEAAADQLRKVINLAATEQAAIELKRQLAAIEEDIRILKNEKNGHR